MKYVGQSRRHSLFSLMYLHISPALDGKATSRLSLTALGSLTGDSNPTAQLGPRAQTTDFGACHLWPSGYKFQITPWMKKIISKKCLFVYITPAMQSKAKSEALMRNSSQEIQVRLKVGWGKERMRGTQAGYNIGSLSRKRNKHYFWSLETLCVPVLSQFSNQNTFLQ